MQNEVDDVVAELQRRVAQRRADGEYPPGLEAELAAEFDAILVAMHGDGLALSRLDAGASELRDAARHVSGTAATASRVPGGSAVHGLVGRLVGRHTNPIAASVRTIGETSAVVVEQIRQLLLAQSGADERTLSGVIAAVLDRLSVIDELISDIGAIEHRLDRLESATPRAL